MPGAPKATVQNPKAAPLVQCLAASQSSATAITCKDRFPSLQWQPPGRTADSNALSLSLIIAVVANPPTLKTQRTWPNPVRSCGCSSPELPILRPRCLVPASFTVLPWLLSRVPLWLGRDQFTLVARYPPGPPAPTVVSACCDVVTDREKPGWENPHVGRTRIPWQGINVSLLGPFVGLSGWGRSC